MSPDPVLPDPVASFGLSLDDPSTADAVQLYDFSFDPGEAGVASRSWDFGDGATSTDPSPTHRFRADGEYTVTLQVTTADGRIAVASQRVRVATHQVSIERLSVPTRARAGQAAPVIAWVANGSYRETVQVELLRRVGAGPWERIDLLTATVPANGGNETDFAFAYVFTAQDAAAGEVTFRAVATLVGARDAEPADNSATAPPTTVQ